MRVSDQVRADAWLAEFRDFERSGRLPALEILHLPRDHTAGARAGWSTPKACMADNDLALGRIVDALSHSRFWNSTVVFALEDDAQDGPDHVDSHRSVLLVISAWNRGGVLHRFVNTTDVLATIEAILRIPPMSSFDHFARPLRGIWRSSADATPYTALVPAQSLADLNPTRGAQARRTEHLDFSRADRADDGVFNRILWSTIKGQENPYPRWRRAGLQDFARDR
jgi:hypothetical protein